MRRSLLLAALAAVIAGSGVIVLAARSPGRHNPLFRAIGTPTPTTAPTTTTATPSPSESSPSPTPTRRYHGALKQYVVLYRSGTSLADGAAAVAGIGGRVLRTNAAVGVVTVQSRNPRFMRDVRTRPALRGAVRDLPIGYVGRPDLPDDPAQTKRFRASLVPRFGSGVKRTDARSGNREPLGDLQWDMAAISVGPQASYAKEKGDKRVLVAVVDGGVDGTHPDLAPVFDRARSRNFAPDMPVVDGPCEVPSCLDPVDDDPGGHGTHVAGTIAAAANGLGIGGVAPGVTLVNIRAGQDSGYFFTQPTVDALTYAGDIGVDVANMSFFVDPWLFNCPHLAGDSSDEQLEQRTIIEAVNRALDYAHDKGVTLVAAAGNEHTDLADPGVDTTSPDFPASAARRRDVDRSCLSMPSQGHHVIQVSATNRSGARADYSNYGLGQIAVAAPGGALVDPARGGDPRNLVLSTEPRALARESGDIDARGNPTNPFVAVDCERGRCATYQYLQGTSMASPHAAGVAALIVSALGVPDPAHPGELRMDPDQVRARLLATARPRGDRSVYGAGLVDAVRAVSGSART